MPRTSILLILALLAVTAVPDLSLAAPQVYLGDRLMTFDVEPMIVDDRTLVPMRAIFEALGCEVDWIGEESRIEASRSADGQDIVLWVGQKRALVNDEQIALDVAPLVVNDRTLVPLRFVSEALGEDVTWDEPTQTVFITANYIDHPMGPSLDSGQESPFAGHWSIAEDGTELYLRWDEVDQKIYGYFQDAETGGKKWYATVSGTVEGNTAELDFTGTEEGRDMRGKVTITIDAEGSSFTGVYDDAVNPSYKRDWNGIRIKD